MKANWHPILLKLLRTGRTGYAVKLWAEVAGLELKAAHGEIEAIRNRNRALPKGAEHPHLDPQRLAYYTAAPYDLTLDPGGRKYCREHRSHADLPWNWNVEAQLTRTHRRIRASIEATGTLTVHCQDGPQAHGQADYKAATELIRNGLVTELGRYAGKTEAGINYAVLTIGPKPKPKNQSCD